MNSLLNPQPNTSSSSQLALQDLQLQQHSRIQSSQMNPQTPFDSSSHDDFLEQMLSTLGPSSCSSWVDETPPSAANDSNVVFSYDDSASLASKFRSHQISAGAAASKSSPTASAAAAAAMMLQHQLMMSRGSAGNGNCDSGFVPMALSLGSNGDFDRSHNDVVDGSSFKSPNPVSFLYFNSTIPHSCFFETTKPGMA